MLKRTLILLCMCGLLGPALAQQPETADAGGNTQQADDSTQTPELAPDEVMPDLDNQPLERAPGQATGRFIPSEQISQDLGVSFPTDI